MTAPLSKITDETIAINKQALIQAALELERQEAYRHFQLEEYIESLEALADKLRDFLTFNAAFSARVTLLNQLLPGKVWDKLISDELLEQWEAEWKVERERSADKEAEEMHLH